MLVLTRKRNESIILGEDIKVTILGVFGNQIRIGIDAPKNIGIRRDELEPLKTINGNKR